MNENLFDRLDPDMRARILAMRETEAQQKADLARVQRWRWERLVLPRNAARRRREVVRAELHPSYWPSGPGFTRQKTCGSIDTGGGGLRREEYHAFHGPDGEVHPVVWHITHGFKSSRWEHAAYYCDAHLPAEYRPELALSAGGDRARVQ